MSAGNDREFIDFLQSKEKGGRSMKCPLLAFAWGNEGGKEPLVYPDCLKEKCAWWNKHSEECCLMSLGKVLNYMADYIHDIKGKMPHEEES